MRFSPSAYIARLLSKTTASTADALTLVDHLDDPSVGLTLSYLAIATGLIGWEGVAEWFVGRKVEEAATSEAENLKRIESLIQLIRAGQHLSIDVIEQIEQLPRKAQRAAVTREIEKLSATDERRSPLIFYSLLKEIQLSTDDLTERQREILQAHENRVVTALQEDKRLQSDLLIGLSRNLAEVTELAMWFKTDASEGLMQLIACGRHMTTAIDLLEDKLAEITAASERLERWVSTISSQLSELLIAGVVPPLSNLLAQLWLRLERREATLDTTLGKHIYDVRWRNTVRRQFEEISERITDAIIPLLQLEESLSTGERRELIDVLALLLREIELHPTKISDEGEQLTADLISDLQRVKDKLTATSQNAAAKLIGEVSGDITEIAANLPEYKRVSMHEASEDGNRLVDSVANLLEEIKRIRVNSLYRNTRSIDGWFEAEYRRAVGRSLGKLHLIGLDVDPHSRRYSLSVAYIQLSVNFGQKILGVSEALCTSSRLLIRGLAGSGKTTLLQWIAVQAAARSFGDDELEGWNECVPFFVRLRSCRSGKFPKPGQFPELVAPAIADTMPSDWVMERLRSGQAVVLIDGVDEVPEQHRRAATAWIQDLVGTFAKAKYIVSSRPGAAADGWLRESGFDSAELQPMTLDRVEAFVDHWHAAVAAQVADDEKDETLRLAKKVKRQIITRKTLRNIATNPLLCAMLCALHRKRRREIPHDRIDLYEECCRLLLEVRDSERGIELTDYPDLAPREKRVLVEDFAYWLMDNGWTSVSKEQAISRFDWKAKQLPNLARTIDGEQIVKWFSDRSLIVREPTPGEIDFTHRTFQEYLAACAASDQGNVGRMIEVAMDDQWHETVILFAGVATEENRQRLIRDLLKRGDHSRSSRHTMYLLAIGCLETAVSLSSDLKEQIEKRIDRIMPPRDMEDARKLIAAKELAVPFLAKQNCRKVSDRAACIRALGGIGGPAALQALRAYVSRPSATEVQELIAAAYSSEELRPLLAEIGLIKFSSVRTAFQSLQRLLKVRGIEITSSEEVDSIVPLFESRGVHIVVLGNCAWMRTLYPLTSVISLTSITLRDCTGLEDLDAIVYLRSLEELVLFDCHSLQNIAPIGDLSSLRRLVLTGCKSLEYVHPLQHLPQLDSLRLEGLRQDVEIPPKLLKLINANTHNSKT